jgi:hypothetical protein
MANAIENESWALMTTAIETNDEKLLDEVRSMICASDLQGSTAELFTQLQKQIRYRYWVIIDRGESVKNLEPSDVASKATLEFLLAHGWDINWRGNHAPFV